MEGQSRSLRGRIHHRGTKTQRSDGRTNLFASVMDTETEGTTMMIAMGIGVLLLGAAPADRVTLKDGTVVLGLVTSTGRHGEVEFVMSRSWADRNVARRLEEWDRAAAVAATRAIEQRRTRLSAWRREREKSPGVEADDRILRWIDGELKRLADPAAAARTSLIPVRLPRGEIRQLDRRPIPASRLLRLAWTNGIVDPESKDTASLTGSLEARGLIVDPKAPPVPLNRLLPPTPEPEALWLARRAATEISLDSGLRFLRYQGTVLPDPGPGGAVGAIDPSMALSEIGRLLNPEGAANRPDPLAEKLRAVAGRGRIGAVVTGLTIAPDLAGVTIETTFWVRGAGGNWTAYGTRTVTTRADEVRADEGNDLAEDPQVKRAFGLVEALGLGAIPAEMKQRSLQIGAATRKALGDSRAAFERDLAAVMLPVLEPVAENVAAPHPVPAAKPHPRRSMLGPKGD